MDLELLADRQPDNLLVGLAPLRPIDLVQPPPPSEDSLDFLGLLLPVHQRKDNYSRQMYTD